MASRSSRISYLVDEFKWWAFSWVSVALLWVSPASAEVITVGHWDLEIAYNAMGWDPHWHDHESDTEWPLEATTIRGIFDGSATGLLAGIDLPAPRPANPVWDFTGQEPGGDLFILPITNAETELPFLGIGTQEIANGTFLGNVISLQFLGILSGPTGGAFGGFGTSGISINPLFSSDNAALTSNGNVMVLQTGTHQHIGWSFSAPGTYELQFKASGTLANSMFVESAPFAATFDIVNAVPEPTSLGLVATFGLLTLHRRRRFFRQILPKPSCCT